MASHPRNLGATPTFSTSDAAPDSPTGISMKSRIFMPYGLGTGYAFGMGAVEQMAYDYEQKYIYGVSEQGYINVVDMMDPSAPVVRPELAVDMGGMKLTDIEICASHGLIFVGAGAADTVSDGVVRVYTTVHRDMPNRRPGLLNEIKVGPLPDMVLPNSDCSVLAVGNEGEGTYGSELIDPPGSVHLIRDPASSTPEVVHVSFDSFGTDADLLAKGVHLPLPKKALEYWDDHSDIAADVDFAKARASYKPANNLEPEYLGWSGDGSKVFVNLQENSAIATISVPKGDWSQTPPSAMKIDALGLKDWSSSGGTQGIDVVKDKACKMAFYTGFKTMRLPDSISVVNVDGTDYILAANEGDDKEYGKFEEKVKAKDFMDKSNGSPKMKGMTVSQEVKTNYVAAIAAGMDSSMRLTVGSSGIDYSTPSAPVVTGFVGFGGRGISIYNANSMDLVWDSGSQVEQQQCAKYPWAHNSIQDEEFSPVGGDFYNSASDDVKETLVAMNDPNQDGCSDDGTGSPGACPMGETVDDRSPKDGANPESMVTGMACGRLIAVTATEKQDTMFVYDITKINNPFLLFVEHLSPASEKMSPGVAYASRELGEIDAESMVFVDDMHSPSGKAGLLIAGAWSGTLSFWEFTCPSTYVSEVVPHGQVTCNEVKEFYKTSKCCGNPSKIVPEPKFR